MTTSRILRHEKEQLVKQTVWYVVVALVVLVLFITVIMPGAVRLFFKILDNNKLAEVSDTLPPQVPVLSLPYQATSSAEITLNGFGEAKSTVKLVVNSSPVADITVGEDGKFQHELRLETGDNELVVYGVDAAGNESQPSTAYHLLSDAEPLMIDVSEPTQNAQIVGKKNQQLIIKGQTKPNTKVYLNDRLNYAKADGTFQITTQLNEGENVLKFRGVDPAGNTTTFELKVTFQL
jgi:hypothetical protein